MVESVFHKCCPFYLCEVWLYFLEKTIKHISKPKGVVKKTVHTKAAKMKKEIIRSNNKNANATSTSKVGQTGIKRKTVVTIAGTASKRSKDDDEDKYDIDRTVHSQKLVSQKSVKNVNKKQTSISNFFSKKWLKNKVSSSHCEYFSFDHSKYFSYFSVLISASKFFVFTMLIYLVLKSFVDSFIFYEHWVAYLMKIYIHAYIYDVLK